MSEEQILVLPAAALEALGWFEGFTDRVDHYLPAILGSDQLSFRPRGAMETDPSFKQLIPYVALQYTPPGDQPTIFTYTRGGGGGESRLHAKWSIGIGGHISAEDAAADDVYTTGMQRELDEEVTIGTTYQRETLGLIYDPSNEVGQVHLGVAHRFQLDAPEVSSNEADLARGQFRTLEELEENRERLETWSQFLLDALSKE